ncbi:MAG: SDR family NAD(P)-dependent oxidoreductase, partial [Desulfamplus sp.]
RVEISYRDGEKYVVHLKDIPLSKTETDFSQKGLIANGDTILVTGGARGITFEILKAVVKRYQTNLIILGRSDIYNIDALSDILAGVESISSIDEKIVMEKLKLTMKGAKPVELKQAANRILSALESRKNIEILKSFGVYVSYIAADVADKNAVISALESVELDHIDGVIHAAGVEESMPFEKKTLDSFERVLNTKVNGCLNVIEAVGEKNYKSNKDSNKSYNSSNKLDKAKQVKFYIGFSSVTAKFGNEGQTDYTAANEMMAAILLDPNKKDSLPKCKIIDWTAWSGAGMATRETVQKVLTERGLKFLPLDAGVKFFMDEMEDSTTPEVVITGLDHSFDRDKILKIAPFLDSDVTLLNSNSEILSLEDAQKNSSNYRAFTRRLDIEQDRFLLDHAMEGTPIFLGATGVETMAEAAMAAHKNGRISEAKNFSIPYGIKLLQNKPKDIKISVNEDENGIHCKITSQFVNSAGVAIGEPKLHYQSDFVIEGNKEIVIENSEEIDSSKEIESDKEIERSKEIRKKRAVPQILRSNPIDDKNTGLIYHPQRLFMDGVFRTIEDIISFDGKNLITKISDRSRESFFTDDPCPQFLTDVVLLDGMFQTGGVFEFLTDNYIVLPYKIKSLKFYDRAVKDREYLCITTRTSSDSETDTFNIDLIDEDGNYLMELVGFEMVKLNKMSENIRIN